MWFNRPSELWQQYAARALELRREHKSFARIAAILSEESGQSVNRNQVAGRLFRDGAPPVPNHGPPCRRGRKGKPRSPRERRPRVSSAERLRHIREEIMQATEPIKYRGILIGDLERQDCRFIVADRPTRYCGNSKADGFSYCQHHASIAYHAPPRRHAERLQRLANGY